MPIAPNAVRAPLHHSISTSDLACNQKMDQDIITFALGQCALNAEGPLQAVLALDSNELQDYHATGRLRNAYRTRNIVAHSQQAPVQESLDTLVVRATGTLTETFVCQGKTPLTFTCGSRPPTNTCWLVDMSRRKENNANNVQVTGTLHNILDHISDDKHGRVLNLLTFSASSNAVDNAGMR